MKLINFANGWIHRRCPDFAVSSFFWTILEGWVGFSKVKSFSLKSSQSRDLTILSTCQGSGSRSFHLVCLRILELVFFIFLLRRLSGSQSWVRQYGIGRLSGTDGELHLCLPGNTQVSLIQSTACLMDNDLIWKHISCSVSFVWPPYCLIFITVKWSSSQPGLRYPIQPGHPTDFLIWIFHWNKQITTEYFPTILLHRHRQCGDRNHHVFLSSSCQLVNLLSY